MNKNIYLFALNTISRKKSKYKVCTALGKTSSDISSNFCPLFYSPLLPNSTGESNSFKLKEKKLVKFTNKKGLIGKDPIDYGMA